MHCEHFDVLLEIWYIRHTVHTRLIKIKAHVSEVHTYPLIQQYFFAGNVAADAAAGAACRHIAPAFFQQTQSMYQDCRQEADLLAQTFQLHLALAQARKQWDVTTAAAEAHRTVDQSMEATFADWMPPQVFFWGQEISTDLLIHSVCVGTGRFHCTCGMVSTGAMAHRRTSASWTLGTIVWDLLD